MTNVTLWLQLGVFLHLLLWLRSDRCFRLCSGWLVAGLVVGYLWRWEMFLVFSVFAAPLLLFVTRKDVRKCVPILVGLCVLVTVDRSWEFVATGEPQYRQYESFNRVRGRFHDRAEGQQHAGTPKALRQVGWSENDYLAYHELWMLYDEQAVTETGLHEFLVANGSEGPGLGLSGIVERVKNIVQGNKMVLPPFVFVVLALLLLHGLDWWQADNSERWRIVVALCVVALGTCAICYARFVSRVSFPLFVYGMGVLVVIGRRQRNQESDVRRLRSVHMIAGILALTGIGLAGTWARVDLSALRSEGNQRILIQNSLESFLKETASEKPVLIQLDPGVAIMHVGCGPFQERLTEQAVRIVPSGWSMRSPRYRAALSQLKVTSGQELLARAAGDQSVYFVLYARPWDDVPRVKRIWETYYQEHFGGAAKGGYGLESVRRFESSGYQLLFFQIEAKGQER
jgi:MFS family permease